MAVPAAQQNPGTTGAARTAGTATAQRVCEVRQFTVAATGRRADRSDGTNGGISVEGQARGDVQILAKVTADAETQARAREIANAIRINPTLERVGADGPREPRTGRAGRSAIRLAVPRALNMSLRTTNGGIVIQDVDSKVEFATTNGGVKLIGTWQAMCAGARRTAASMSSSMVRPGRAKGSTSKRRNGGVRLVIPEHYSAQLEAHTNNGGLNIDVSRRGQRPHASAIRPCSSARAARRFVCARPTAASR